jgi:ubiquinone/menaquinone biosynthesis C-methylase UbiE
MENEKHQTSIPSTESIKEHWTDITDWYAIHMSNSFTHFSSLLYNSVVDPQSPPQLILDLACGDGKIACDLVLLKPESCKLLSTDLVPDMCSITAKRLQNLADRLSQGKLHGIKSDICSFISSKDAGPWNGTGVKFDSIKVEVQCASNEDLKQVIPENDCVDAIIACLSLHIVSSPETMLSECFRVLKKGCKAVFSVWGSSEGDIPFALINQAKDKYDPESRKGEQRSLFHLNSRPDTVALLQKAGFANVTSWESFTPFSPQANENLKKEIIGAVSKHPQQLKYVEKAYEKFDKEHRTGGLNVLFVVGTKP